LLAQSDIQLAKERLLIERERINADYLFVNPTAQDITVPVVFPKGNLTCSIFLAYQRDELSLILINLITKPSEITFFTLQKAPDTP
ncbi:DUF4424 domain-containing protein, partial [Salmonella enterica subsp. enterica serovar Kentucky]|nr:DUF4424 domain-containing protein [Salmonella enterica subsp. enterica serovar Kentucky]